MSWLLRGTAVSVAHPNITVDEFGDPIESNVQVDYVDDVLVQPGSTSDLDATRPNGVEVSFTLHFPKTYTKSLRGCSVEVFGETYEVIGDPRPWMDDNTPGPYNRTVEVGVVHG